MLCLKLTFDEVIVLECADGSRVVIGLDRLDSNGARVAIMAPASVEVARHLRLGGGRSGIVAGAKVGGRGPAKPPEPKSAPQNVLICEATQIVRPLHG